MKSFVYLFVFAVLIFTLSGFAIQYVHATETYSFVTKWGTYGTGDGQFDRPVGITMDDFGNVYVSDLSSHIQKFTSDGIFITKWGSVGSGDGQFDSPGDIAIDSQGDVYVTDRSNNRVQKFTSDGIFITKWGSVGSEDGQFISNYGIAIDSTDHVYVSDLNNRVQKFTSDGIFITKWGSLGDTDGKFHLPLGIAVDSFDNILVSDNNNHRIQKFTDSGVFITKWDTTTLGDTISSGPVGVTMDSNDNVYIADSGNFVFKKFTSDGTLISRTGGFGVNDGQFQSINGIASSPLGEVYVADFSNYRIQKFAPPDTTLPTVTLTPNRGPDSGLYYNHPVTFTVTGTDTQSGIASCDSPIVYSGPDGNSVSITGHCTDNSSNIGNGTATFKYDHTNPDTQVTGAVDSKGKTIPNGTKTSSKSVKLTFSGTDNIQLSGFQCSMDSSAYSACTSPITYSNFKAGKTHIFNVRAIDAAGNIDATPAGWTWK